MCVKEKIFLAQYKYKKYLVVNVEENKILDYQVEMINNNKDCGIIPINTKQFNSNIELNYEVTELKNLDEYIAENNIDSFTLLSIIKNISNILKKCDDYFLYENNYLLEVERIFINPINKVITMIYFPLDETINEDIELEFKNLIKNIILSCMNRHWGVESKIGNLIINYIDNNPFDLEKFERFLISINMDVTKESSIEVERKEVRIEEHRANKVEGNNKYKIIQKEDILNENIKESKVGNIIVYTGIVALLLGLILITFIKLKYFKFIGISIVILGALLIIIGFIVINFKSNRNYKKNIREGNKYKNIQTAQLNNMVNKSKKEIISREAYNTELLEEKKEPYLMYIKDNVVEKIEVNKNTFKVGRLKEEVDLLIPVKTVGKLHAKIIKENGKIYLVDLDSKNGTYINGKKISSNKGYELEDGDEVTFVNNTFIFKEY